MGKLWANHGTKIIGLLVSLLGIVGAMTSTQLAHYFGATWAPFVAATVGGLLTILRGFQGPAQNPPPPNQKGFIDWHLMCVLVAFLVVLSACAALSGLGNQPLDAKIGAAKETVGSIESTAAQAVTNGSLSKASGQQVYDIAQNAVKFLDQAHALVIAGNDSQAQTEYALGQEVLQSLQAYVNSHLPKQGH